MIPKEGGGTIEHTALFEKYELCRVLGRGRSGTVYLARHKELEEYRAIKQVPKTCAGYGQFRREAMILKELRHPGIPIVYDLEEDEDFSYLIEEFLEGDSLYALVSNMGHLSKAMTVRYGIQICRLVYSLHIAKPYPILYLDLQPENLLLCQDTVKLVDFDHAVHLAEADRLTKRYGTIGCAAPEQYTGEPLDERTDIYAIGAVLYYMLTGQYPGEHPAYPRDRVDRQMARLLAVCLQKDREKRFQSADVLLARLEQILMEEQGVFDKKWLSSLTIAVAGAKSGAGTTHAAMGLAAFMMRRGFAVLYEERNDSGAVRQFAASEGTRMDRCGIYRICGLPMLPRYGEAVRLKPHPYQVVVRDYGADLQALLQEPPDGTLLVCPGKPWEWQAAGEAVRMFGDRPGLAVVCNHFCSRYRVRAFGPTLGARIFLMPFESDPLRSTRQTERFYSAVYACVAGEKAGGGLRKLQRLYGRIRGRAGRKDRGGHLASSGPADIQE